MSNADRDMTKHEAVDQGVKVLTFVKRPPAMDVDTFQRAWRAWGADAAASASNILRYVQNLTLLAGYRGREPLFDGVSEIWRASGEPQSYESMETLAEAPVERAESVCLIVEDFLVKGGRPPTGARKCFALTFRRPDLAAAAFHAHWRDVHGPIAARIPGMIKYVQCHAGQSVRMDDGRVLAGCAITWWASSADLRASMATPEYEATLRDEPNFIDGVSPVVLTTEHVVSDRTGFGDG